MILDAFVITKKYKFINATKHFANKFSTRYMDLQTTLGRDPNLGD